MMATETETTETERVIAAMLTENTGIAMMDSGGDSGRAWQRNQAATATVDPVDYFKLKPEVAWDRYCGPIISVFHFLTSRTEYAGKLDRAWRQWCQLTPSSGYGNEVRYYNGIGTANEFIEQLVAKGWVDGDADFHGSWVNTYNGEDGLSQTLQYVMFRLTEACPWRHEGGWGGDYYCLLSIHGGADVRGGYTDLHAFHLGDWEGMTDMFDNAQVEAWCNECPAYYQSDNAGCSWEAESGSHDEPLTIENSREYPYGVKIEADEETGEPVCPNCNRVGTIGFGMRPVS